MSRRVAELVPALAAGLCTMLFVLATMGPALLDDADFDGDAPQHQFWAQEAWHADPLAHDASARFFASDAMSPVGWRWLMEGLATFGDIQRTGEVAGIALVAATGIVLYALGRAAGGSWGGLVLVTSYLAAAIVGHNPFGKGLLQRHFAPILLAGGLLGLLRGRLWMTAIALVATSLLYPIALAVLGLVAATHTAIRCARDRRLPRGWPILLGAAVVALAVVGLRDVPEVYGDRVTLDEMRTMPNFGPHGRQAYDFDHPSRYFTHGWTGLGVSRPGVVVGGIVLVGLTLWRRTNGVWLGWLTIAASLLVWTAAHLVPFHLYLPHRHAAIPLPLAASLIVAAALPIPARQLRATPSIRLLAAAAVVTSFAGLLVATKGDRKPRPPGAPDAVIAWLRDSPPDTLVASHPRDADDLPLRTGRTSLVAFETLVGWYPRYHRDVDLPRTRDVMRAYHADGWADVDRLAERYGVDVFYWTPTGLDDDNDRWEPLRSASAEARDAADGPPVLAKPPPERVILRDGDRVLVRVGSLRSPSDDD